MAHAQKPDFFFRRNGRVHLNRQARQFSRLLRSRGVRISGSNAGYTIFRGSVICTGYTLRPPASPSLPIPCVTVCHHISTGVYYFFAKCGTHIHLLDKDNRFRSYWHLAAATWHISHPAHLKQNFEEFPIYCSTCEFLSTMHVFSIVVKC